MGYMMLKLNNENIETKQGWEINGIWYSTSEIITWGESKLTKAGITEEEPPDPPQPTQEEMIAQASEAVRFALQSAIDMRAQTLGFSNGNALMLYAGFTNAFQSLAQTFATWEASVWVEAGAYKAEVLAGTKPMLTGDEAVALMPEYPS